MAYRISVDTGGTFTDVVVSSPEGTLTIGKSLTTPARIINGMRGAIEDAAGSLGLTLAELFARSETLIYGTTRATNAIVTKTAARTAFVTTLGFPDTLVLKEGGKFNPHDFSQDYPEPYIARRDTFEVGGRIAADGSETAPFDEAGARLVAARLRARGYEAVAVCFLWSVANPAHESAMGEILDEMLPGVPYTLSHQLIPIVREYRRASATAIDASLKPLMQEHLRLLEQDLRSLGFAGEILVSTTAGGCNAIEAMIARPIYTIGSGPAMAPIAGITFSRHEDRGENVIVCDTGGTTFDVGLVRDGRLTFSRETWLGPQFTGDLLGISAVDMRSIGAGGGSIAWIDEGGLMRVGPQSAGAEPGPACYGRGGLLPTVSDAAAALGYFDPDFFLGGRMKLDLDAARAAIARVAGPTGRTIEEAAYQILSLASDLMVRAIGDITINEGLDPRESAIVAGGGAAGLNIMAIARELGCRQVILPRVASALSASGMHFADVVSEESRSVVSISTRFDYDAVNAALDEIEAKLEAFRAGLRGDASRYRIEFAAEARYLSQVWDLDTPLPARRFAGPGDLAAFVETFHRTHERIFAVRDPGSPVEVSNWKARLTVTLPSPPRAEAPPRGAGAAAQARLCFFGETTGVDTPVYRPGSLDVGRRIEGPAIIEEPTTTLVVFPGMAAEVSANGNYLLHIG